MESPDGLYDYGEALNELPCSTKEAPFHLESHLGAPYIFLS